MSTCRFSIPYSGDVNNILAKANTGITGAGGKFTGDASTGDFSLSTFLGAINGNYIVDAKHLNITITDKPMFLSCDKIEEELRKRLGIG